MPKRVIVCDVVGTGTREDPYRAQVRGLPGVSLSALIPTGANGHPTRAVCLALVSGADLTAALAASGVDAFPDVPFATLLSTLTTQQRNALQTRLTARGFPSNVVSLSATLGELVRRCGQFHEAGFRETGLNAGG